MNPKHAVTSNMDNIKMPPQDDAGVVTLHDCELFQF